MKTLPLILSLVMLLAGLAPAQTTRPTAPLVVYNGTANWSLPGLRCVVDDGQSTWAIAGKYDADAFRAAVMRLPKNCVYILDQESGVNFDARRDRAGFDATIKQVLEQIAIVHATRPDVDVGVFPAFVESETSNTNLVAALEPDLVHRDAWYIRAVAPKSAIESASCSWANDQLRPIHAASDVIPIRAYFSDGSDADTRRRVLQWVIPEGHRIARGQKPMLPVLCAWTAGQKATRMTRAEKEQVRDWVVELGAPAVILWMGWDGKDAETAELAEVLTGQRVTTPAAAVQAKKPAVTK